MGCTKADLRLGERSLLEWVARALRSVFEEILIVASVPPLTTPGWARPITDEPDGLGPLAGLYAGLKVASAELNFVAACDIPFLRPRLVEGIIALAEGYEAVIPEGPDGLHPLCGAYSRACLGAIREALEAGQRRVVSFFPQVRVRIVSAEELRGFDPDLMSLLNVNTPADLKAAARAIGDSNLFPKS